MDAITLKGDDMKITQFRKTIPYTDNVRKVIENGSLKVQRGQWFQLPWLDSPSRFVGITKNGVVWMVHCYKENGKTRLDGGNTKFQIQCKTFQRV